MTLMADELETAAPLREVRAAQETLAAEIRETSAKLDRLLASPGVNRDRFAIELAALRGRM
ncbi:MAG: hypothetical protein ACLPWS_07635, partial [Rhodomicrobium sp.]